MEDLLYRILSRQVRLNIDGLEYIIKSPDVDLKYRAELYKKDLYYKYRFELPHLENYNRYLIANNFIEADFENKISNMNKTIKKFKVELFLTGAKIETEKRVKEKLSQMRKNLNSYYSNLELYQKNCLEYFVNSLKNKYLLINTTWLDNKLVFDPNKLDLNLLTEIISELNKKDISSSEFRDLALSDDWRSYYLSNQSNIFGVAGIDLSEEQKILCGYTRMYQNALEHPDCPPEEIIRNHDKFDGWMIHEQEKSKNAQKEKNVTELDPKFQEVYKMAETQEEANAIYNVNTQDGVRILKERAQVLKTKDEVKDKEFRDVKLDILSKSSQAQSGHFQNIGK